MKKLYLFILISILISGCSNFNFKNINEFNIDKEALPMEDIVDVIYWSGAPNYNFKDKKSQFYCQYIVVSQTTHDTVRVFSTTILTNEQVKKPIEFISQFTTDSSHKLLILIMYNLNTISQVKNVNDIATLPILDKVVSNKKYLDFESRNYKTTIGLLGLESSKI